MRLVTRSRALFLSALWASLPTAHGQTFTKGHAASLTNCLDEGSEYVKTGLFLKLGVSKDVVLSPPRFPTGTRDDRRAEIIEEVYRERPTSYRSFARNVFLRCVKDKN